MNRYYIVHVEQMNKKKEFKPFTNLKDAKYFIKRKRFNCCPKHYWDYKQRACSCVSYSLYSIGEKKLSEIEYGGKTINPKRS